MLSYLSKVEAFEGIIIITVIVIIISSTTITRHQPSSLFSKFPVPSFSLV